MCTGKELRLNRIIDPQTGRTVIVPMDHGTTVGPLNGIQDLRQTVKQLAQGGADAIVVHKGMVRALDACDLAQVGLIVHLSASTILTPAKNTKTLVAGVEEAVAVGADAISVHVNLGDEMEGRMLSDLGQITAQAGPLGLPVLAMVYARGPLLKNGFDVDLVSHCARVGEELGADIVKVAYPGDAKSFGKVVRSCSLPVVIAGGEKMETEEELLRVVQGSVQGGGAGLSIGRNVFQAQDPVSLLGRLRSAVHGKKELPKARNLDQLQGEADVELCT